MPTFDQNIESLFFMRKKLITLDLPIKPSKISKSNWFASHDKYANTTKLLKAFSEGLIKPRSLQEMKEQDLKNDHDYDNISSSNQPYLGKPDQ